MKKFITLSILACIFIQSHAQSNALIGEWKSHLPYDRALFVCQSDDHIFFGTESAIAKIHKVDNSLERIEKTEGLTGSSISAINYHNRAGALIIAYVDGSIDIVSSNNEVLTNNDIKNFSGIPISKKVNKLIPVNTDEVLICASFGLSKMNIKTGKFIFTTFIQNNDIKDATIFNGRAYLVASKGCYSIEEKSNRIQDFNSWQNINDTHGLPLNYTATSLAVYANQLCLGLHEGIYNTSDGVNFSKLYTPKAGYRTLFLSAGPHLIAGFNCAVDCNTYGALFDTNYNLISESGHCAARSIYTVEDQTNRFWYADMYLGFRSSPQFDSGCELREINSPASKKISDILIANNKVYVTTGGVTESLLYSYTRDGILIYDNQQWSRIHEDNTPIIKQKEAIMLINAIAHPSNGKIYVGSYYSGLLEINTDGNINIYDKTNSGLKGINGDPEHTRVYGLGFDKQENLWMTCYLGPVPLVAFTKDGKWKDFTPPVNSSMTDLIVDNYGNKWISFFDGSGIMVFNEGNMDNPADDKYIFLNSSNTNMTTNKVYSMAIDKEGDVWIGTAEGPIVFECGSSILDGKCKGSRRKVDQDGIIGFLLETDEIRSIAVDGANRKWFGTKNGIYVQNATGEKQEFVFNTANSPLISNTILSLAIHPQTGEVWIGTELGLQVFRTDATDAKNSHSTDIYAFPNPVKPDYKGVIAIKGLARDARVKITDAEGRLVYETIANGGQAIWNGEDYLGNRVSSGVYLVFSNSTQDFDKTEGAVTKIMVVN